jgi:hypothetical protein
MEMAAKMNGNLKVELLSNGRLEVFETLWGAKGGAREAWGRYFIKG